MGSRLRSTPWLWRVLIGVALLACAYGTVRRGLAAAYFRHPTPERIEKAVRLDPGRPQYHAGLARVRQHSPDADLNEVIRHYETAARLSPRQANYWADLADAYELAGRLDDAERAYEHARQAAPNSPQLNWQRGNFLLRRGQAAEALEAFRPAVLARPELRRQAFDLAWRASDDSALILARLIPPRVEIGFEYLNYLIGKNQIAAAQDAWRQLLAWQQPFEPRTAFPYLDALRNSGRPTEMQAAWMELAARAPLALPRPGASAEAITNGGFETDLLNGGLDWRVEAVEGAVVAVDTLVFFEGARSLRLEFDGRHNLDYRHLFQYVPVAPRTAYRFSYFVRTEKLSTESGPRFLLEDAYDPGRLRVSTGNVLGSARWALEQVELTTGPETRLLVVRLARPPSEKLDNRLAGRVWIDQVSLTPLPGRADEKTLRSGAVVPD